MNGQLTEVSRGVIETNYGLRMTLILWEAADGTRIQEMVTEVTEKSE